MAGGWGSRALRVVVCAAVHVLLAAPDHVTMIRGPRAGVAVTGGAGGAWRVRRAAGELLGLGGTVTHQVRDGDPDSAGTVFVDTMCKWYGSVWDLLSEGPEERKRPYGDSRGPGAAGCSIPAPCSD
ncbi:hypothetical protein [Streptomyces massasporeus]|uniref:hypothetical protein n=1 Tax=Streptomyces massasporeus TaxID=67324 RepID=UPI003699E4E9